VSAALPTAGWPLPSLLGSLARAGWGELNGRANAGLRTVLRGLEVRLPRAAAAGLVTEAQLADSTGLSIRWVRRCLGALERLGLIEWHRGGISAGKARPSLIKVCKRSLVALIGRARPELAERLAQRAEATAARIARLPAFLPGQRHNRRSRHAEVSSALSPLRGGTATGPGPAVAGPSAECRHGEPRGERYCALCRYAAAHASP
jgi:hypothetical protein